MKMLSKLCIYNARILIASQVIKLIKLIMTDCFLSFFQVDFCLRDCTVTLKSAADS